jgi:hypothetical protein
VVPGASPCGKHPLLAVLAAKANKRSFDASITQGFFFGWPFKTGTPQETDWNNQQYPSSKTAHPACHNILN